MAVRRDRGVVDGADFAGECPAVAVCSVPQEHELGRRSDGTSPYGPAPKGAMELHFAPACVHHILETTLVQQLLGTAEGTGVAAVSAALNLSPEEAAALRALYPKEHIAPGVHCAGVRATVLSPVSCRERFGLAVALVTTRRGSALGWCVAGVLDHLWIMLPQPAEDAVEQDTSVTATLGAAHRMTPVCPCSSSSATCFLVIHSLTLSVSRPTHPLAPCLSVA